MKHITLNKTTYRTPLVNPHYVYIRQEILFFRLFYQDHFLVCKVILIDFEFSQLDFISFSGKQH